MAKPLFNFSLPTVDPTDAPLSSEITFNVGKPLAEEGPIKFSIPPAKPPAKVKDSTPQPSSPYLDEARRYIRANEGVVNRIYNDKPVTGKRANPTIGVGHLVTKDTMDYYGDRVLSADEIETLLDTDLNTKIAAINREFGSVFENMPDGLKVAMVDGYFRGDLPKSPKTISLLKAGKYAEAADEYLNNDEYRASVAMNARGERHGVAGRMAANAAKMRLAARKQPTPNEK